MIYDDMIEPVYGIVDVIIEEDIIVCVCIRFVVGFSDEIGGDCSFLD